MITVFLQSQRQSEHKREERAVINIISGAKETPKLIAGLQYFIKKFVAKTDIAGENLRLPQLSGLVKSLCNYLRPLVWQMIWILRIPFQLLKLRAYLTRVFNMGHQYMLKCCISLTTF